MAVYRTVLLSKETLYHSRLISRVQIDQNVNGRHILQVVFHHSPRFGIIVCIIVFHVHAKISEESLDPLQY